MASNEQKSLYVLTLTAAGLYLDSELFEHAKQEMAESLGKSFVYKLLIENQKLLSITKNPSQVVSRSRIFRYAVNNDILIWIKNQNMVGQRL